MKPPARLNRAPCARTSWSLLTSALLAAAVSCAHPPAVAAPPADAPPAAEPELPRQLGRAPCPPEPPPPADFGHQARCGNGRMEVLGYERVCASCIPNSCCPCGWAPTGTEECDGANLGGKTCESLGFLGGTLRCTEACKLDSSGCESTARRAGTTAFAQVLTRTDALPGDDSALARNGRVLAVAAVQGPVLRVQLYDADTLAPRGPPGEWRAPAIVPPGAMSDYHRFESALPDTLGPVVLAAMGDGFVGAVEHYGRQSLTTFHVSPEGQLGGPVSTLEGSARPLFLVPGGAEALLGFDRGAVQVVRVGADGRVREDSLRAVGASRLNGSEGAAAFVDDEWRVASGSRVPNASPDTVSLTRIGLDGRVRESVTTSEIGGSVRVAAQGQRTVLVYSNEHGLYALDGLAPAGKAAPLTLAQDSFARILAAELRADALTVWTAPPTGVQRTRVGWPGGRAESARVLSEPRLHARAALLEDGVFHLLFSERSGSAKLYLAR